MNCGLHRISSNVERIVRPGLKPPRGACPGHVRLSAVSNPQSCREMLNHWSCPFVGHGFGPSSSDGKLNEEASRYTSCGVPWPSPAWPPQGLSRQPVDLANRLCVARILHPGGSWRHAEAYSSRLLPPKPSGTPCSFARGALLHKWMRWLASVLRLCQTPLCDLQDPALLRGLCILCCHCTLAICNPRYGCCPSAGAPDPQGRRA